MNHRGTYLNAQPATPISDTNLWRVDIQYHDHVFWKRIDVYDNKARTEFIQEWCELSGIDFHDGLWIFGAIDEEVADWLKRTDEVKLLRQRVDALQAQVETMEREWGGMKEKYEDMKKWVLSKLKGTGNAPT